MRPLSVPPAKSDHVLGSLGAPIVIVEYGDYDCPHTRRAHATLQQLMSESPGRIALVFRHFPLRHLHANAQRLSELMEGITDASRYWAAHESLMAQGRLSLILAKEQLTALSLDVAELSVSDPSVVERVEASVQQGLSDGVHSTPSFFFNGAPHDGHYDLDTLRQQLAAAPSA